MLRLILAVITVAGVAVELTGADRPPNVVIVMPDDQSIARFDPLELTLGKRSVRVAADPAFGQQSKPRFITFQRNQKSR